MQTDMTSKRTPSPVMQQNLQKLILALLEFVCNEICNDSSLYDGMSVGSVTEPNIADSA